MKIFSSSQVGIFISAALLPVMLILGWRAYPESEQAAAAYVAGAALLIAFIISTTVRYRLSAHGSRARRSPATSGLDQAQDGLNFPWEVRDTGLSFEIRDTAQRRIAFVWYVPLEKNDIRDEARLDRPTAERVANMITALSQR